MAFSYMAALLVIQGTEIFNQNKIYLNHVNYK